MKNFKILTLTALASLVTTGAAVAANADAEFTTTVASYCTIGQTSPGIMHVSGKNLSTDTPAELVVNNNEGTKYQVSITKPSDFSIKPNAYTGSTSFTTAFGIAGANSTVNPVGNDVGHNLDNAGSDAMSVSIFGTSDIDFTAGSYTAVAVASCVAQ